jgi:hypothetical protein
LPGAFRPAKTGKLYSVVGRYRHRRLGFQSRLPRRSPDTFETDLALTLVHPLSHHRSKFLDRRQCHDSAYRSCTSADAFVEIDHLGPIHTGINIADRPTICAAEMGALILRQPNLVNPPVATCRSDRRPYLSADQRSRRVRF